MSNRPFNFAPGPAVLPEPVLQRAAEEMLSWQGSGMSVMEMTHRGPLFSKIHEKTLADFRALLGLDRDHEVLFMQGGATAQNAIVPMNLLSVNSKCDYVHTGHWSAKSIEEAKKYGDVHIAATASTPLGTHPAFGYIPKQEQWQVRPDAAYLHICGNETIGGVEYHQFPNMADLGAPDVPLVVDMSSHVLSRPMDFSSIGLAYGGAQKNIGPSGLTFVILHRRLIESLAPKALPSCPSVFDYRKVLENNSLLNTPSTFAIYMAGLVFEWLIAEGGVTEMARRNTRKAKMVYDTLDASAFYRTQVDPSARSKMNIPFYLPEDRLYDPFLRGAAEAGLLNLKGHKAVGGLRASLYNAMPVAGAERLVDYLKAFEKEHG
ncbi:MAG: 3-phosphoserine/phosphohydroxythreonine transaminase [Burkholderiaceae bacterium]